jgi:hypothetical protein
MKLKLPVALALFFGIGHFLHAQTEAVSPMAPGAVPQNGTFFSTQNRPPLPYD